MCKRNSPDLKKRKKEASTGCVRETPQIKKIKPAWDVYEKLPTLKRKRESQHGMCKRNSPDKNEANTGCVRETPQIKMKPSWDV